MIEQQATANVVVVLANRDGHEVQKMLMKIRGFPKISPAWYFMSWHYDADFRYRHEGYYTFLMAAIGYYSSLEIGFTAMWLPE